MGRILEVCGGDWKGRGLNGSLFKHLCLTRSSNYFDDEQGPTGGPSEEASLCSAEHKVWGPSPTGSGLWGALQSTSEAGLTEPQLVTPQAQS